MENLWLDQKVTNRLSQTFSKRIKGFKSFARIKTNGLKGESNDMLICQKTHLTVRPFEIKGSLCGMEKKETCKQSHELWFETELLGGQQMLRSTVNHRSDDNMELGTSVTVQSLWQHWGCLQLAGSQSLTQQEKSSKAAIWRKENLAHWSSHPHRTVLHFSRFTVRIMMFA